MEEIHIGKKIRGKLDEQGRGIKWFAEKLGCSRKYNAAKKLDQSLK